MPAAPLAETVARALSCRTRPVILADSGDNPTGGGVGDRADVLAALIAAGADDVIVAGIADAPATQTAHKAGRGAILSFDIGGTLDPSSRPVAVRAEVLALSGAGNDRQAVLGIGGIRLVVTERRRPFHALADFIDLGLDPRMARLVVVKSGYLSPELAPLANPGLMALTDGAVPQDVAALPNLRRARPCFPFDPD
jgi:microcystin degradation protein MlrC